MAALTTKTVVLLSRHQVAPALGAACMSKRDSSNLASYKRGRGGRSSFSGNVVTVFGSSGFLGKIVVNRLGKIGSQVICPYRGEPYYMKDLKLAGDLGQILFLPYHLQDEESVRKVMKYSNVVINLVGRDWETKNFNYDEVHVKAAGRIARLARELGVEKLVHFSALNANPAPPKVYIKGGSNFLKSKYAGELAVREEFPDATIFRPADMFGDEDRFVRYYANAWRRHFGTIPLYKMGKATIKMPVFVSDVAEGVIKAIHDEEAVGKTYECVGPRSYYLSDLIDYFTRCMRWEGTHNRSPMNPLFKMKVRYMSYMPSYPIMSMEKLEKEHVSDELTGTATLEELGVTKLLKLEDRAPYLLKPFRKHAYYEEKLGEFPDPAPPPIVAQI